MESLIEDAPTASALTEVETTPATEAIPVVIPPSTAVTEEEPQEKGKEAAEAPKEPPRFLEGNWRGSIEEWKKSVRGEDGLPQFIEEGRYMCIGDNPYIQGEKCDWADPCHPMVVWAYVDGRDDAQLPNRAVEEENELDITSTLKVRMVLRSISRSFEDNVEEEEEIEWEVPNLYYPWEAFNRDRHMEEEEVEKEAEKAVVEETAKVVTPTEGAASSSEDKVVTGAEGTASSPIQVGEEELTSWYDSDDEEFTQYTSVLELVKQDEAGEMTQVQKNKFTEIRKRKREKKEVKVTLYFRFAPCRSNPNKVLVVIWNSWSTHLLM